MFDDEEDEFHDPKPSRASVIVQLGIFVVVMAVAGVVTWWMLEPRAAESAAAPEVRSNPLAAAEIDAKKLPEFVELRRMARRQLDEMEITRALALVQHPNAWIRLEARSRLAAVRDGPHRADAVRAVASGLSEGLLLARVDAMMRLADMNARECEPELRAFLTSPTEDERRCARRALEQMALPME